jgi:uncharacterized membrane protein
VDAVVRDKDVVLALLGASAGFAGLVLVFLGLLVAAYQSFEPGTPKTVLGSYRKAAVFVLAAFFAGLICVGSATAWLVDADNNQTLYLATLAAFSVELALLIPSTVWVIRQVMWS